ncbi:MAG: hypothetical protein QNK04_11070 [Myxococcota bacterium]|nr:hypothetical protein [Myxococcota bacterium]
MYFDPIFVMALVTLVSILGVATFELLNVRRDQRVQNAPARMRRERSVKRGRVTPRTPTPRAC